MVLESILYTSLLIAFVAFFVLYERGFSLKNSLVISLFVPFIGSLFIVSGLFLASLVSFLALFGLAYYVLNRKKMGKFSKKNIKFKVYKI